MKKTNYFEIIGVLSLSLILTSAMSVSGSIPAMIEEFSSYSRSSVELLLSVPAFAMMTMIALSPIIARYVPEKIVVSVGLFIFAVAGLVPVFVRSYPIIFAFRILFGLGTGLVNAKAVTMIGERFSGELQQKLQGIRCSMETIGQATLTLAAGQLLVFGWNYSFLIYAVAFIILILFLLFVPVKDKSLEIVEENDGTQRLTKKEWMFILRNALLGFLMVSTNVSLSLRIPSYVIETGAGMAVDGSNILSLSTFAGFIAGLLFGILISRLQSSFLFLSLCIGMAGLGILATADSLLVMAIGAILSGFCTTSCTSYVFSALPVYLPKNTLTTANAAVLVGCNLGSFTAPFVLQMIGRVNPSLSGGFLSYSFIYVIILAIILLNNIIVKIRKQF